MASYQDIADYYEIDRINGNTATRALASLLLYRFVKGLLRHMGWPDSESDRATFGTFEGSPDSARVTVNFVASCRTFDVYFEILYTGPKVDSAISFPPESQAWRLTIEKGPEFPYTPRHTKTLPDLYERVSELVFRQSLHAQSVPPKPPAPAPFAPPQSL